MDGLLYTLLSFPQYSSSQCDEIESRFCFHRLQPSAPFHQRYLTCIPRPDLFEIVNHLALHLASSALLGLKLLDFFDQRVAHDGPERRLVVSHAFSP